MWALGRAAPTPLVPSAQREAATGLPYRRPGAQRPRHLGAERVARGGDGSQWLPCLAQRARSALAAPIARSAERETAIRLAARALARSARAIGAERAARGAALAEPAVPQCVH